MSQDRELEIRRQFLDEAQEYLDTLDAAILGIADQQVDIQRINAALRAAHSIKGGAGMMGFQVLSDLAHRLEDSFKVLKVDRSLVVQSHLENLLLTAVGFLREVIESDRETLQTSTESDINPEWLSTIVDPIFDQLHTELGDPRDENASSVLSPEDGQDIVPMLFETEVEGCLQRLEIVLETPGQPCLREEVAILAQELAGVAAMFELTAFVNLCHAIAANIETTEQTADVAQAALQAWRRAQSLVITGNYELIPPDLSEFGFQASSSATAFEDFSTAPSVNEFDLGEGPEIEGPDWYTEALAAGSIDALAASSLNGFDLGDANSTGTDWYTQALASEELPLNEIAAPNLAVDDHGYTEYQPIAAQTNNAQTETQVTDFKILEAEPEPVVLEEDQDTTVRVPVRKLNQLNDLFGELTIDRNGLDLHLKRLRSLSATLHDRIQSLDDVNAKLRTAYDRIAISNLGTQALNGMTGNNGNYSINPQVNSSSLAIRKSGFDALELDQYNDLHLLSQQVMEMIVQLQEVSEDIDLSLNDGDQSARNLTKTAKQLHSGLNQLRMRPLSDVFDRFPRAVREWSLQYNKRVQLDVSGSNTLVDRNILESLNDPLMHLIRNAFDHGIEMPEVRESRGKSPDGLIEIRASHQGNRTVITIRDDGEGIPIRKIRARAEQMGLDPMLLESARDEELLSLIFEPGFSTRDRVTELSGRGVGMDVVHNNLKQIRGEISVNTQPETGTTFTLSVPFTLSTVKILLAECDGMLLAFPTDVVEEIVLSKPEHVIQTPGGEVLNLQDNMVQLVRLQDLLQFNCPRSPHGFENQATISTPSIIVIHQNGKRFGIHVDRCWGEQETTIRRVEGNLPLPKGFGGCNILGDGRVVPLVNASELLRLIPSSERSQQDPVSSATRLETGSETRGFIQRRLPGSAPPSILIVDDSINVRRFLALTLERAGYVVEQAKDGQEALDRLENGLSVQAIICDIEMPRLDGYGFLARVRANSSLKQLPVVMLTSRSGEKHRRLADNLGATSYFSKPYNEQVLLQTIDRMVKPTAPV
jgi:chemosensory pili system protein ChpA (sensor histidine kinase/response regulator)